MRETKQMAQLMMVLSIAIFAMTANGMDSVYLSDVLEKTGKSPYVGIVSFSQTDHCDPSDPHTDVVSMTAMLLVPLKGFSPTNETSSIRIRFPRRIDGALFSPESKQFVRASGSFTKNDGDPFLGSMYSFVSSEGWPEENAFPYLVFLEKSDLCMYNFITGFRLDCFWEMNPEYINTGDPFSIPNDQSRVDDSNDILLIPSSFTFGERTEIERPVLTAMLRNDGDRTVHVTDVIRTCVCANLELSTTNLPPGGAAEVRCTLDPNVFSGPFLKTFFIKTDDPATPSITVPIRGSVRQLWEVSPDKWYQLRAGETNAVLRVKAAPDAPALVRTEILGPAGASFELRPAGEREFDAVFAPGDQPRGQHHWTVNLYPEGAETPALGLHLGAQVGEHWKCVPARLRAPVNGRDFVADLLVKPADGKDLPADVDPAAITISPVWDHVSIEPLGPPTWRGIPLRLTVGAEMVSSWEFPKTFYLTIPGHGAASVFFEKIVPLSNNNTETR